MSLKEQILTLVKEYYHEEFGKHKEFVPGDRIAYAAREFDHEELVNLVDSSLDFWLTAGRYADRFEREFREFLGIKHCALVNSGSSANLLAFMALTSPLLGEKRILPGDEVITVSAGFPTTVSPVIQYGAIPVFVDITLPQYNVDCNELEKAVTPRTKAVMLAHTLGNPFDIKKIIDICKKHGLWLIEDNCDALGSKYCLDGEWKYTGTFGDIGTSSFYPPHHMTMGEGGAVYTDNPLLNKIVVSLRDWGRDCICPGGVDNVCNHRFDRKFGQLPLGYDHKYVYSHFGYNLKVTDMQAAIGCAQLKKLPDFIKARRENWQFIRNRLECVSQYIVLPEPAENSLPAWFGFLITVNENSPKTKDELVAILEGKNIQTRMLFAGNLLRHPCFDEMRQIGKGYRVVGNLNNSDRIIKDTFWIGVYPGRTRSESEFMTDTLINALNSREV